MSPPQRDGGVWTECAADAYAIIVHGPFGHLLNVGATISEPGYRMETEWEVTALDLPIVYAETIFVGAERVCRWWMWVPHADHKWASVREGEG